MVPTQGIIWLFSCLGIIPNNTTIGRAEGQADGLAHIPEKL